MTQCPACGFWKLNEFFETKQCKRCPYKFVSEEKLNKEVYPGEKNDMQTL